VTQSQRRLQHCSGLSRGAAPGAFRSVNPDSLREWALRQGWGGRPVRVEQAQGILVAALGVLAGWYGYGKS
jgi:hypothetical protein